MANSLPRRNGIIAAVSLLILIGIIFIDRRVVDNHTLQMVFFGIYNIIGSNFTLNKLLSILLFFYIKPNYFQVKFQPLV